jgi:hypothetical protein
LERSDDQPFPIQAVTLSQYQRGGSVAACIFHRTRRISRILGEGLAQAKKVHRRLLRRLPPEFELSRFGVVADRNNS